MKELKNIIKQIENLGWTVTEDGENKYMIGKFSPAGQDFNIYIEGETPEDLIDSIYEQFENFDVSYETYIWLNQDGHGTNGAPYDMRDLYNDMEFCEQMILELYNELSI